MGRLADEHADALGELELFLIKLGRVGRGDGDLFGRRVHGDAAHGGRPIIADGAVGADTRDGVERDLAGLGAPKLPAAPSQDAAGAVENEARTFIERNDADPSHAGRAEDALEALFMDGTVVAHPLIKRQAGKEQGHAEEDALKYIARRGDDELIVLFFYVQRRAGPDAGHEVIIPERRKK